MQTFEHIVVEGDMVGVWATYEGAQKGPIGPFPASQKYAKFSFGSVMRIADGKIAEWVGDLGQHGDPRPARAPPGLIGFSAPAQAAPVACHAA
jgi:hypothetical protein